MEMVQIHGGDIAINLANVQLLVLQIKNGELVRFWMRALLVAAIG